MDGRVIANKFLSTIKNDIASKQIKVKLVVILVGNNPASQVYIRIKREICMKMGVKFLLLQFNPNTSEEVIISSIQKLNQDKFITGIVVQLPLPNNFQRNNIIDAIDMKKDVDGLRKNGLFTSCAAAGIMELLKYSQIRLSDKRIVLIGNGVLVGKPLSKIFKQKKIDYMVCDKSTKNINEFTKKADIIISAAGVPLLINDKSIKQGAIVVDAGTVSYQGRIVGDVDLLSVQDKVNKIAPVPGGVGPMTIAMLMKNILHAYTIQHKHQKIF